MYIFDEVKKGVEKYETNYQKNNETYIIQSEDKYDSQYKKKFNM